MRFVKSCTGAESHNLLSSLFGVSKVRYIIKLGVYYELYFILMKRDRRFQNSACFLCKHWISSLCNIFSRRIFISTYTDAFNMLFALLPFFLKWEILYKVIVIKSCVMLSF